MDGTEIQLSVQALAGGLYRLFLERLGGPIVVHAGQMKDAVALTYTGDVGKALEVIHTIGRFDAKARLSVGQLHALGAFLERYRRARG